MALSGSLPQINLGVQGETQGGPHNVTLRDWEYPIMDSAWKIIVSSAQEFVVENTHRRPSGKRPKKRRFRGNQFMNVCSHTYVAERKDTSRLTDRLIDKLAHYYGNAIRSAILLSVKKMRKAIWAVWGHSCSTDDEPMHWFCPTNPNTWCKYNAAINNNLQNYKHKPSVAKAVRDVIKPVFADLSHPHSEEMFRSDEAHFWLNGYVNKQNCRIWSEANPQVYVETPLHPEKLTVWCALWAGGILLQKR
ncbi:uncharacterized protein TNCV_2306171 [Trichonephila clavipes]|nr:uncharacterized protein TNCV_2306171 [Trichonephila clavipes]